MRRMSSFVQGLRRISTSSLSFKDMSLSPDRRRVSSSDLVGTTLNGDDASTKSRQTSNQQSLDAIVTAEEIDPAALVSSKRDVLPRDRPNLEGLLNYHVAQVERIKREVDENNETIEQLMYTYYDMSHHAHLMHTTEHLHARIQGVRNSRNRLAKFVLFHLQEMERIGEMKQVLNGHPHGLPKRVRGLPTYREWNAMFSI
ncbi:hypothetical protein LOZ58_001042 [Ophidiomyces ophidiicola]|nr:hypothetical protein LOZ65_006131 [Ophidiomyces ophidiicola]KAI1943040.1 hypothetical protein LOZ66_000735 [Ophidiomyces ophidiicola]KAI1965196.1 hypothetical protein LOZ58_001042 [Ophidiomyces ophidiicola]